MQLRKNAIALSLLATLILLFGGWFLYQKLEVEQPIRDQVGQMQSADLVQLNVGKDHIQIDLKVTNPELFPLEYKQLLQQAKQLTRDMPIEVTLNNQSKELEQVWMNGLFSFTEAVDLHQYSRIPEMVSQWKTTYKLDEAIAQMDADHVYVYLKRGTNDYYAIVPRTSDSEVIARG
ncbi:hypothetical protein NDK47_14905 [Brevibacillus ruminantium]|uniref:Uncharacterized protein n=1 Tax=Brevibacillus ruminantium TaxID=2950604 RepID=A0ABY4WC14_9BACL|nr:hypothetical protein [Brevibacillus ruminantium]USG63467.1 hypothetical protein NDK47_14905 [Brevibacillus ruminantium]